MTTGWPLLALLVLSCAGGNTPIDGDLPCQAALLAGDLVITEVMANPEGDDEGNEFFEIYNATTSPIDLTGLKLKKSNVDDSKLKEHSMTETIIDAGQYMALGGVLPKFKASYIAYGYSDDLGTMTNGGGKLQVVCGDVIVDSLIYGEATSGHSSGLDGNLAPDHLVNDSIENFCDGITEFATDSFGSPGASNGPCSIVDQTTCLDGDTVRDVVKPATGQLVITEVMPNPAAVEDAVGEWFEVYATADFDLNGLVAGKDPAEPKLNIVDANCLKVLNGDRLLFARSTQSADNGGLAAVDYSFSFGLVNGGDTLFVGVGDTTIDEVSWTGSSAGKSLALDIGNHDASANDDEANWCDGQTSYGDGDLGTPREANLPCDTTGMCMDNGILRATVPPLAADVTITEFMPNPDSILDSAGEWFEVHFAADADLNGLQMGRVTDPYDAEDTIDVVDCLSVTADSYQVFARNVDPLANGGLPTNAIKIGFGQSQGETTTYEIFVGIGDALLDSVSYLGGDISAGASRQIDSNDVTCDGTNEYWTNPEGPEVNLGTPGAANNLCL